MFESFRPFRAEAKADSLALRSVENGLDSLLVVALVAVGLVVLLLTIATAGPA